MIKTWKKNSNKLLYFEWSPPWHVGWRLSGEGCHWEYDGKNGEFENIDFRFPWLSDTSEMGFGHDVPFLNYSDRLPHPSDLCQPDRVRWGKTYNPSPEMCSVTLNFADWLEAIFWRSFWHIFWHSFWHIFWYILLTYLLTFFLTYLLTFFLTSFWHIFWYILLTYLLTFFLTYLLTFFLTSFWHIFWHSFWQNFWHSFWHIFWHIFPHAFWHIFWHSFWHIKTKT